MKVEKIGEVPGNILGMMADLCHKLQHGNCTSEQLAVFLKGKNPFPVLSDDLAELIRSWEKHLKKFYGIKFLFSEVKIPDVREGFNWTVPCPAGLRENQIYDVLSKYFPCWRYVDDLDKAIVWNERSYDKNYIIRIRDRVEADEELKNLSAEDIKKREIKTMILRERMLLEGWYYDETGKHLDIQNITLCAGSRASDGRVPSADWDGGRFEVSWCYPRDADPRLRARAAVSF